MKKILIIIFVLNFISLSFVSADTITPSAITNLSVSSVGTSTALLSWSAPNEDGVITQPQYVIIISVDGMGSEYVMPLLSSNTNEMTTFLRLLSEGSGTLNARDDADYAITLPNHATMITGRSVAGTSGHNWTSNTDPLVTDTLATNKGSYVASVFDVAHDNGLRTGLWSGKSKFSLFPQSYSATTGALDTTGVDNGRNKIDYNYITSSVSADTLTTDFINQMTADPFGVAFVHYQDPDATGHSDGWSTATSSSFATTLKSVDTAIGRILTMIEGSETLNGKTTVIVTADHGGHGTTHGDITNYLDYTIPFYVWGAGVSSGDNIYNLNSGHRTEPAALANPDYSATDQPIRDGDVGNLALGLLGLNAIPGSNINNSQDLTTLNSGAASSYDIRFSTSTIIEGNWASTSQTTGEPTPAARNTTQTFNVPGLNENTRYYFAMKSFDNALIASALSNVANALTSTIPAEPTPTVSHKRSGGGGGGNKPKPSVSASSTINQTVGVTTTVIPPSRIPVPFIFYRDFSIGTSGLDIKYLQTFLNDRGFTVAKIGSGSFGAETTFFGPATQSALTKYQLTKNLIPASGNFDLKTRLFILIDILTQRLELLLRATNKI